MFLLSVVVSFLSSVPVVFAATRIFRNVQTSPLMICTTTLQPGAPVVIETKNLVSLIGGTPDTVLYVWDADQKQQIAWDDDSGVGYASRVTCFSDARTRL